MLIARLLRWGGILAIGLGVIIVAWLSVAMVRDHGWAGVLLALITLEAWGLAAVGLIMTGLGRLVEDTAVLRSKKEAAENQGALDGE